MRDRQHGLAQRVLMGLCAATLWGCGATDSRFRQASQFDSAQAEVQRCLSPKGRLERLRQLCRQRAHPHRLSRPRARRPKPRPRLPDLPLPRSAPGRGRLQPRRQDHAARSLRPRVGRDRQAHRQRPVDQRRRRHDAAAQAKPLTLATGLSRAPLPQACPRGVESGGHWGWRLEAFPPRPRACALAGVTAPRPARGLARGEGRGCGLHRRRGIW